MQQSLWLFSYALFLRHSAFWFHKQLVDAIQPCLEVIGRQAKTDPQVVVHAKVVSQNDEHALFAHQKVVRRGSPIWT
jgi:hypothetical protein